MGRFTRGDQDVFVLTGDTPLDVEAAHFSGAKIVAVAMGKSTIEELHETGADLATRGPSLHQSSNRVIEERASVRLP